ncbi:MAG: hypothetical protein IPJ88_13455 [Myxococcales bacterium]|nr:MAG: hypothetical protein IPJ88_13455 [Myxococcales bacterium]
MKVRKMACSVLGVLSLLVLGSCGSGSVSLRQGSRAYTAGDYEQVYKKWTRAHDAFEFGELRDVLAVTATFESWDFRWAYTVRYAKDYSLPPAERQNILDTNLKDSVRHHSFFVTLAGGRFRESDISDKDSAWRVLLINEKGQALAPVGIEKIGRPRVPERVYFPSMSPHRQAFRVVFPVRFDNGEMVISRHSKYVVLRFTGAVGKVDLTWELQG